MSKRRKPARAETPIVSEPAPAIPPGDPLSAWARADRLRPWLLAGVTALVVCRTMFPSESAALEGDGLPAIMLWLALAVMWLLGAIGKERFAIRWGAIDLAVLALVGWHTLAGVVAVSERAQRPALNMLWEWIGLAMLFFLARQTLIARREIRALAAVMIALAAGLAGVGFYQVAVDMPATRAEYAADPQRALAAAHLHLPPGSPERARFEKRLANAEPVATFALTNSLAGFLAPWLVIAALGLQGSRHAPWAVRPYQEILSRWARPLLCILPIAACLLLTRSRSGLIAALVGLGLGGLIGLFRGRSAERAPAGTLANRRGLFAGLAVLAVAALVGLTLAARHGEFLGRAVRSFGYRVEYWRATWPMIVERPWLGCGPGNFQNEYTRFKLPSASEEVIDPHNFLLEVWATAGTPALLALLAVLGCFAACVRRAEAEPDPPEAGRPAYVYLGAALGVLLAWPVALLAGSPPSAVTMVLVLGAMAVVLAGLWTWVERGSLTPAVVALGLATLLIDWLTSGGIGYPALAGTFWLLLALGTSTPAADWRSAPRWVACVLLVAAIGLVIACYGTAYSPVLYCKANLLRAINEPLQAERCFDQATADDPWDAQPWNQRAQWAWQQWERNPRDDTLFAQYETYARRGLAVEPNSAPAWAALAGHAELAFEKTGVRTRWETAVAAWRKTIGLYPNRAEYHARLALTLRAGGQVEAAQAAAAMALDLDAKTPHADKKLPTELRAQLSRKMGD